MKKLKKRVIEQLEKNNSVYDLLHDKRNRIVFGAALSLTINIGYAVYNGILGFLYDSLWFLAMCAYYAILSVMRFGAVSYERKTKKSADAVSEKFVMRFTGIMLVFLSFVLGGSVYYSTVFEVAEKNGSIVMITIATYTFYKVIAAIRNLIKVYKHHSMLLATMRNISCADAAASVLSLQRSMLASFEGMRPAEIKQMNVLTGIGVCLVVFVLGLAMMIISGGKYGKIKIHKSK